MQILFMSQAHTVHSEYAPQSMAGYDVTSCLFTIPSRQLCESLGQRCVQIKVSKCIIHLSFNSYIDNVVELLSLLE